MNRTVAARSAAPSSESTSHVRLINTEFGYPRPTLMPPTSRGYLYVAATVQSGLLPVVLPSRSRAGLLADVKSAATRLRSLDEVVAVDVFRAIVKPPTAAFSAYLNERRHSIRPADFDLSVLIQTRSVAAARRVQALEPYTTLLDTIRRRASHVVAMTAENVRRIGDVETNRNGLFLFNHFVADDPDAMLELWEYLAGWYVAETGLRTSIALMPLPGEHAEFTIVNWARWDVAPIRHFWHQLSKRGFWKYVAANLDANHAASMPIYLRLA